MTFFFFTILNNIISILLVISGREVMLILINYRFVLLFGFSWMAEIILYVDW